MTITESDLWGNADSVQAFMTRKIIECSRASSLLDVEKLLTNQSVSRVVVTEANGSPVGIISEKDILRFMLSENAVRGLDEVRADEVMSSRLIYINPSALMAKVAQTMIRESVSSLVVKGDQVEGIVTKGDIAKYLAATNRVTGSVEQFMTSVPIAVNPSNSALATIQLMSQKKISRVVIVDQDHVPKGIITLADFALLLLSFVFEHVPTKDFLKRTEAIGLTASDFMMCDPLTIDKGSDLSEAARLMTKHRFSGLPVTDNSSKLAGMLSNTDITRAVANQ